jgi:ABC-type branched-subunit amino acid transport system substrate-binding protein
MKIKFVYLSLILLCLFWACAPKKELPPLLEPTKPPDIIVIADRSLYEAAEDLYAKKSYEAARDQYVAYIRQFPRGEDAAMVLMRLGEVHTILKEYEQAVVAYRKLIDEHPQYPYALEAMIGILRALNLDEKFNDAIQYAFEIPEKDLTQEQLLEKETLLGDAFLATGSWMDAFYFYSLVYKQSKDSAKERMLAKLLDVLPRLNRVHTDHLLSRMEDPMLRGHLLYHMGLLNIEAGRTEYAIEVLVKLIDLHPEHQQADAAKDLLKIIFRSSIKSPYRVGCLLPLSGPYKIYGNRALNGIELAFEEYNRKNEHAPIRIIVKDTGSDPYEAMLAVQELDEENVAAIIGPIITAEPAAYEAQSRGIPIILFTQKENITLTGDFVFRNFITPKMQVRAMTAFVVKTLGLKRFAILYPEENYGKTFMNLFWDALTEEGGQVAGVESFDPEQTDFAKPIKKLVGLHYDIPDDLKITFELLPETPDENSPVMNSQGNPYGFFQELFKNLPELFFQLPRREYGPLVSEDDAKAAKNEEPEPIVDFEAIFIPDAPKKAGLVIPQLAFYDIEDVLLIGTNLWHSSNLLKMSRKYVQGAVLPNGFFEGSNVPQAQTFTSTFERIFDEEPGFIEAVAYDSAHIVFRLLSNTDIRFKSRLKDELLNLTDYPGVTGKTSFDYKGDALKKLYILKIKGNRFVEIQAP